MQGHSHRWLLSLRRVISARCQCPLKTKFLAWKIRTIKLACFYLKMSQNVHDEQERERERHTHMEACHFFPNACEGNHHKCRTTPNDTDKPVVRRGPPLSAPKLTAPQKAPTGSEKQLPDQLKPGVPKWCEGV